MRRGERGFLLGPEQGILLHECWSVKNRQVPAEGGEAVGDEDVGSGAGGDGGGDGGEVWKEGDGRGENECG